jgi:hypothetical protein
MLPTAPGGVGVVSMDLGAVPAASEASLWHRRAEGCRCGVASWSKGIARRGGE